MTTELSIHELEDELIAELPTREALSVTNWSSIWADNKAVAFNIMTNESSAKAVAYQQIDVTQMNVFAN
jgi:hypothetical protein